LDWSGFSEIIYEKGASLYRTEQLWYDRTSNCGRTYRSPESFVDQTGLRPVLVKLDMPDGNQLSDVYLIFPFRGPARFLNIEISALLQNPETQPLAKFPHYPLATFRLNALVYRFQQLCLAYASSCRTFAQSNLSELQETTKIVLGGYMVPHFELIAFIADLMRTYNALRYVIWRAWGYGTIPRSLESLLKQPPQNMPLDLIDSLRASWKKHGTPAREYRDCIEHYAAFDEKSHFCFAERLSSMTWVLHARLPDNPEKRNAAAFTFNKHLDALSYSWELVSEVVLLWRQTAQAIHDT
jgi:hypothetical protein